MPEIERHRFPETSAEFQRLTAARKPLLFPGAAASWPALSKWSDAYLRQKLDAKQVTVTETQSTLFEGDPEKGHYHAEQMQQMAFSDFFDAILATPPRHYNLHRQDLRTMLPELREDIVECNLMGDTAYLLPGLWMGPRGSVTQLHHDFADNLFTQVRGQKRVILADPDCEELLHRFPFRLYGRKSSWHLSLVKTGATPDLDRFPDFAGVDLYDFVMQPGDMLYLPVFWWHELHALGQPTVSVSQWWDTRAYEEVLETIFRLTQFAEDYESLPRHWRAFVRRLYERTLFANESRV
jgi:hypothetical protein